MGKPDTYKVGRGFTRVVQPEPLNLDDQQWVPWEELGVEDIYIVWGDPLDPSNAVWVAYMDGEWHATACYPKIPEQWNIFPFIPGEQITRNYSVVPTGLCAACDGPCSISDYLCEACRGS